MAKDRQRLTLTLLCKRCECHLNPYLKINLAILIQVMSRMTHLLWILIFIQLWHLCENFHLPSLLCYLDHLRKQIYHEPMLRWKEMMIMKCTIMRCTITCFKIIYEYKGNHGEIRKPPTVMDIYKSNPK